MFTFGYNSKVSGILRACSAIGIGLVMIASNNATEMVVKVCAAFLFGAGAISVAHGIVYKKQGGLSLNLINAFVDVVLGLMLFIYPAEVAHFVVYLVGALLLIFGAIQLIALAGAMSLLGAGFASLLLSLVGIGFGIVLLFSPFSQSVMSIVAGCGLIYYGATELWSLWKVSKARKVYETRRAEKATIVEPEADDDDTIIVEGIGDAKEVDYEKVDEQ